MEELGPNQAKPSKGESVSFREGKPDPRDTISKHRNRENLPSARELVETEKALRRKPMCPTDSWPLRGVTAKTKRDGVARFRKGEKP
jgi:hypothetical protein